MKKYQRSKAMPARRPAGMKMASPLSAAAVLALAVVLSGAGGDRFSSYPLTEKNEIRRSFAPDASGKPFDISLDNVFGSVRVEGWSGKTVDLAAEETFRARTPETLALAKKEVRLEMTAGANSVEVVVDGPFRCQTEGGRGVNWRDRGYIVRYDFVLKVPRRSNLVLRTVTDGDIDVRGVEGRLDVHNVNGRIELEAVAGRVAARTVNGRVRASFLRPPAEASEFKTVNGGLELVFADAPDADFEARTTNGHIYSDFTVTALPGVSRVESGRSEERFTCRSRGYARFRVGAGGPTITLETMNGNIVIGKKRP